MSERVTLQLRIRGTVQGVGFRYAMQRQAAAFGVSGWVRNRSDGSVEAIVQGEAAAVEALRLWAARGPRGARVTDVEAAPASGEFEGFEARPTA